MQCQARPLLAALALGACLTAASRAGVTVGLHFVEGAAERMDFMPIPVPYFPEVDHLIEPWQMTNPANQFVLDGAFAGKTEAEVRAAVVASVKERYHSIPTPQGYLLDIDFQVGEVSGPGTVNVIIGKYKLSGTWFGFTKDGGGLGAEANGENNSAVSVDRIDSRLQVDFIHFEDAINAIANVVTHEVAHLFDLKHVWAAARADLGWQPSDPVVTHPFDVMATAASGLPEEGWLEKNIFTSVPGTQAGGLSSVDRLIQTVGLKWTDSPLTIARNGAAFELRWPSRPGKVYDLVSSTDLSTPPSSWEIYDPDGPGGVPPHANLPASGTGINALSVSAPDSRRFFAVGEKASP